MIEHKHCCTSKPLTIELSPYGLTPASIGYGQVERTLMQVVPEHTGGQMAHRIEIVVGNHLRLARGTAGEVHQHRVLIVVHVLRTDELRRLLPLRLPVVESLRDGFAMIRDRNQRVHCRTIRHCSLDLTYHVWIIHTDDGFDRSAGIAIYDIFLCEHVGGGNHDGANLTQGQHHHPPLVAALQDEHHGVVLADAEGGQIRSGLIGLLLQLSEGGPDLLALVVSPQDSEFLGCLLSPRIHHIVGEVEVLGDDELQILIVILYRRKLCLF